MHRPDPLTTSATMRLGARSANCAAIGSPFTRVTDHWILTMHSAAEDTWIGTSSCLVMARLPVNQASRHDPKALADRQRLQPVYRIARLRDS